MKKIISILCIFLVLSMMTSPVYAATKDTKAPKVSKTYPVGNTAEIMVESTIVVRFSENILKGKNYSKVTVKKLEITNVPYTCEISGKLLKITTKEKLEYDTLYTVTIPSAAVKDKAGNNLKAAYTFNFVTEKDPAKPASTQAQNSYKYILEMEASMDHQLTDAEMAYFASLIKMFGIDATFKSYKQVK